MPRRWSSAEIEKALARHGFAFVAQSGSHRKFRSDGIPVRTVIVPAGRKQLQPGTLSSILKQAGLSRSDLD